MLTPRIWQNLPSYGHPRPLTMPSTFVQEWQHADLATFQTQIAPRNQPAILRGAVAHWPAVKLAQNGPEALCQYLMKLDNGQGVDAILLAPQENGRLFYNAEMSGFNFARKSVSISSVIEQMVRYSHFANPPTVAIQSALISACLPGFLPQHAMPLFAPEAAQKIAPRIWLGGQVVTPAHFDESENLACVVAGKRRFTLFPPEQVGNLYIGPLDFAPTPTPISMVDLRQPDFVQFPRLHNALEHAQIAELEAGDALYIPSLWWHHVESLAFFNVLVNYWWQETVPSTATPLACMLHCLAHMQQLSPEMKRGWRALFDHYVFAANGDPAAHIPAHKRGILATASIAPEH